MPSSSSPAKNPPPSPSSEILLEIRGEIAIITLNRPDVLNALDMKLYYRLACLMREVAANPDVYITVLTGRGRYFSAGADVTSITPPSTSGPEPHREQILRTFVANNLDVTHAFYTHPKILITALNGPAIGLSAALIAHSDFIYAAPHAFILTPFTSLGLVAEGGASRAFVQRLGISKANEALIMSRRIEVGELLRCGFVNGIIDTEMEGEARRNSPPAPNPNSSSSSSSSPSQERKNWESQSTNFLNRVLKDVIQDRFGFNPHLLNSTNLNSPRINSSSLNPTSLLEMKALIRKPDEVVLASQTVAEVLSGLKRFETKVPYEEFRKVAGGEKRYKL